MSQILSPAQLAESLRSDAPPRLIDVRLQEDHHAEHLPGAANNCVYEVSFLERMEEQVPDRSTPVCVYGASAGSHEAHMAAEKLDRAGYASVFELREGIAGWKSAGLETETGDPVSDPSRPADGSYPIDLEESRVEWTGRNLLNKHWGTVGLKSGSLRFDGGSLAGAEFVLDLTDLTCTDLAGNHLHDVLIDHLQSDDFFDVERFPEARFVIDSAREIPGQTPGSPNLSVEGNLTLKGETHPVRFEATAGLNAEGKPAAQASFSIDRTKWNVIYGSGKFFKRLAGHLVNDEIDLEFRIVTV